MKKTLLATSMGTLASAKSFALTSSEVTAITGAIDYSAIVTGIGAIAALVAVVYVAMKGARMLMGAIKGA
jgi:hypothetical protein